MCPDLKRQPFRGWPIRRKLLALMLATATSALLLSFSSFGLFVVYSDQRRLVQELSTLAQVVGNASTAALVFRDSQAAREGLAALRGHESILASCLYQKDGALFAVYRRPETKESCPVLPATLEGKRVGRWLELWRPLALEGERVGSIYLISDMQTLRQRMLETGLAAALGFLLTFLFVYLLSANLQRRISAPIMELAEKSGLISQQKDYSLRVAKRSEDELGYLAESLNEMLAQIETRDEALRRARDELEQRVAERTEELLQEIAERKLAAQQLKESEEVFRAVSTSAQDALVMIDDRGRVSFWNDAAANITGYAVEEALGMEIYSLISPMFTAEQWQRRLAHFAQTGQGDLIGRLTRGHFLCKRGQMITVEFSLSSVKLRGRWHVVAVARDITAQLEREQQLARLGLAIEQSSDTVVITDPDGKILYVNPATSRITGYALEELIGHKPSVFKSGKHDQAFYRGLWETLLQGRSWSGRLVNKKKDGTFYEEVATISPVRDGSERIINYVAVKRDVTRETALQEQMTWAQRMDAVGRLAGGMAHDFNNLLAVVLNYCSFIAEELPADSAIRGDLDEIRKAAQRGATLTKQLLTFSRKQMARPEVLEISRPLREMENLLRRQLGEQIELLLHVGKELWKVEIDHGQFEQVLMNLVINARDAMPGGGKVKVELTNFSTDEKFLQQHPEVKPGQYVRLTMSDTGCGMSEEVAQRIFEPFFTTKEKGKGTGLGLATVYGVIAQAGGSIWVESQLGSGSLFTILLPRTEKDRLPTETASAVAPASLHGEETVLVVEDEDSVRELTRRILDKNGYRVLTAGNAAEALEMESRHHNKIDLLLTDVIMPKVTGPELAEQMRRIRPEILVLFMSGYADTVMSDQGVLEKVGRLIRKPFTEEVLLQRIRELLDRPSR